MTDKHHDDEPFTDDELRAMEAASHLVLAQHHILKGEKADGDEGGEKITKAEARYRLGTEQKHCELCSMFLFPHHDTKHGDGTCTLVEGTISPQGLCDHYERRRELANGSSADHGVHYERVAGAAEPGSFRMPHHAVVALSGGGDGRTAGVLMRTLFGVDPDNATVVPAETVANLGNGDPKAGVRVLKRFVEMLAGRRRPVGGHYRQTE